jgi:hypothetical protein
MNLQYEVNRQSIIQQPNASQWLTQIKHHVSSRSFRNCVITVTKLAACVGESVQSSA